MLCQAPLTGRDVMKRGLLDMGRPTCEENMRSDRLYRAQAIILRRGDFFEADRLLTLYTPHRGKMRAIAKGIRKPTSRKGGHLELFTHSQLLLARGRNLDIITQAQTIEPFLPLREDLLRASYACYVGELLDQITEENIPNPRLFYLLRDTLARLGQSRDLALTVRFYELRLLGLTGYEPQLFHCVRCRGLLEPQGSFFFSPMEGGALCEACGPLPAGGAQQAGGAPLSLAALKVLRFFQTREYELCQRMHIRPALHSELERVMYRYIAFTLERDLKSVGFLNILRRQDVAPNSPSQRRGNP